MTLVLKTITETQSASQSLQKSGLTVGFVPTMGALHEGHLELVRRAKSETDKVFVSIFVNPTQFNDPKDLEKYPRTFERDLELLMSAGCDYLFYPTPQDMYPFGYHYKVTEDDFSKKLCGSHRPGHFDGVLTVVMKLLNIVNPISAYFGEKDHQQLTLIKKMTQDFFMPVRIVPCPTVRESDGLAMSSRNMRLTPEQRQIAPQIYKVISSATSDQEAATQLTALGFKVDYVETLANRRYAAAFLGDVRLIDNVEVRPT